MSACGCVDVCNLKIFTLYFSKNFANPINSLFTPGPYDLMVYLIKGLDVDRSAIGHPYACSHQATKASLVSE